MKTIGLIGGMSWESTVTYYNVINRTVKNKLGGLHSAKCILYSVDFQEIEACQSKGDWEKSGEILANAARCLEKAGADFVAICTNTMHKIADQVSSAVNIPLIHIADVTANRLIRAGISKTALLGTKYTMEQDFYKKRITDKGIEVIIPGEADRNFINSVIFNELCLGVSSKKSKADFLKIISGLSAEGAESVILGCTEIGMIIGVEDPDILVFDTAIIHAEEIAFYSLKDN